MVISFEQLKKITLEYSSSHHGTAMQPFRRIIFLGCFFNWLLSIETLPYQHFGIFFVCFCFHSFICLRGECYNPYRLFSLVLEQMCRTYDGPNSNGTILFLFYFLFRRNPSWWFGLHHFLYLVAVVPTVFVKYVTQMLLLFFEIPFSIKFSYSKYF